MPSPDPQQSSTQTVAVKDAYFTLAFTIFHRCLHLVITLRGDVYRITFVGMAFGIVGMAFSIVGMAFGIVGMAFMIMVSR